MNDRPRDIPRAQPSAGRIALRVGEVDVGVQFAAALHCLVNQPWIDIGQHHLRTPEEMKSAAAFDRAPVEVYETVASRALHKPAPIVERTIPQGDGLHVNSPYGRVRVAAEELLRLTSIPDAHMYVLIGRRARSGVAGDPRQVPAIELNDHIG